MELVRPLARNLNRLREERGLTVSGLSQRSGISKSTLLSLESGEGQPTIESIWAIANVLDAPFGSLLENGLEGVRGVGDDSAHVRLIERGESTGGGYIEVYSMSLGHGCTRESAAHAAGVHERVVVTRGTMLTGDRRSPRLIGTGEAYAFDADVPHVYTAPHGPVQAMVFVEYPGPRLHESDLVTVLRWPENESAWDGARGIVERMCIEVANGVAARMLRLHACPQPDSPDTLSAIRMNLVNPIQSHYRWPVVIIAESDDTGPFLAMLPQRYSSAFGTYLDMYPGTDTVERATKLARIAEASLQPTGVAGAHHESSCSWTLEALASECSLRRGKLRMPSQLHSMARRAHHGVSRSNDEESFSSRILVDHYDAFELLHPAYARQVVAMSQDILELLPDVLTTSLSSIDVGTGPGVPLLMLKELLPLLKPLAVEPDPVAYACLQINTRDTTDIELHQGGFLELCCRDGHSQLITSVGSSHHFNTAFMLQKAFRLLKPGGVFCVADEFLPPFDGVDERNIALVLHHSHYILDTCSLIERSGETVPDDVDGELYRAFRSFLVPAVLYAQQGYALQAERLCRQLFSIAARSDLKKDTGHSIGAYTRFFWLELQAMVAGFDYEVERKTHVRRFEELAKATGFDLVRHRRVFATHGPDERDGGTHVITLRKPLP